LICAVVLLAWCLWPAFAAGAKPDADPERLAADGSMVRLGDCEIKVLKTYFWRDWMPIVSRPGPDRGSPLRAEVTLMVDNSSGSANKLCFNAAIVDKEGKSYPVVFHVLADYHVLPDDIAKSFHGLDIETRKSIALKYNVKWNGELKTGEVRKIRLNTADGPYLTVGTKIHVVMRWTDRKGNSAVLRTPDAPVNRTD
jgi:hypothetical protein